MKNFKNQILEDYFNFKMFDNNKIIIASSNKLYDYCSKLYDDKKINMDELDCICNDITRAMLFAVEVISNCPFVKIDFDINKPEFESFYNYLINSIAGDNRGIDE